MNILDTAKGKMRELADKANDLSGPAGEKLNSAKSAVAHGLDGAGKFVDEKTGGKYASKIHNGVGKAKDLLGHGDNQQATGQKDQPVPPQQASGDSGSGDAGTGPERPSA
jgi:MT0933-like antitoxin protein